MRKAIYFFIIIILANLLGVYLLKYNLIKFFIVTSSIIILIYKIKQSFIFKICLIVIGIISFINIVKYYSIPNIEIIQNEFRIDKKFSKDIIVKSMNYPRKKYLIRDFNEIDEMQIGMILELKGKRIKSNYYDIGVAGEIKDYSIINVKGDSIYNIIKIRSIIKNIFIEEFGEERGGVLSGLAFGDTSSLDKDYREELKKLGLIHISSVSGFHINLIFIFLSRVLSFLPSIFLTFGYLGFTGFKVSGIRAFTMVFLKELAPRLHRTYDGINVLCISGSLILLLRPYEIFNLGFIYSFAATLGILMFNNKVKDYLYRLPKLLAESISLILSAQVFIFPISILMTKKLEFGFLLSNIFLVPFYSILMILGIIFIFLDFIPLIGKIIARCIKIIFDIIDGGLILIKSLTPEGMYLLNILIIFIICLYILYFFRRNIGIKKINIIVSILFSIYLLVTFNTVKIEIGQYYDKNYVIVRDEFRNFLYLNGKVKNSDMLKDNLGVDKIFSDVDVKEGFIIDKKIKVDLREKDTIKLVIDNRMNIIVDVDTVGDNYYSNIYPKRYYFIF